MRPTEAFAQELRRHGFSVDGEVVPDGRIRRAYCEGDRKGSRNGYYALHAHDWGYAGLFGNWKSGPTLQKWTYRSGGSPAPGSWPRRERTADDEVEKAARKLHAVWRVASEVRPNHPYLLNKGVGAHGIRQAGRKLLIPLRTADGELVGLQTISDDGSKRLFPGSRKTGAFHLIGTVTDKIYVAEGYANAATLHELTNQALLNFEWVAGFHDVDF